ncbi:FliM/FliN family flagellar motor switch protein [Pseudomonas congelans]|uniref:FliM/FliN family flagellar motor switch protein n=1 Tax=Pseudomonas congelans TaxID=200452 RepID=UPI0009AF834D|nr:FliM/FliN family flagellar motor switch protein [Pseudomonas congelans]
MNAHALPLRRLSHAQVRIARRLAGEPWMDFSVSDQPGRMTLRTSRRAPASTPMHWFDCALGKMGLSDAQAVLGAWSSTPAFITADSAESWLWPLYNAGLSAELANVLGALQPSASPEQQEEEFEYCELTLQLSAGRLHSVLALPAHALADWLEQPVWNVNPPLDHSGLALTFAMRLGRLSLPWQAIESLRPGDVLCPGEADFDTAGHGALVMGPRHVRVRIVEHAERLQLEVLQIEERTVTDRDELDQPISEAAETWAHDDAQADDAYAQDAYGADAYEEDAGLDDDRYEDDAVEDEDGREHHADPHPSSGPVSETPTGAFNDLALPLTLRCGQINLTLGELATLVPGTVLEVPGIKPGLAGLYYGERRLAQGELVDVEGRLGLQILQVDERG